MFTDVLESPYLLLSQPTVALVSHIAIILTFTLQLQARCPTEALRQAHTRMDLLMHARCSSIEVAQAASDVMQMAAATGNQNAFTSSARFTYVFK